MQTTESKTRPTRTASIVAIVLSMATLAIVLSQSRTAIILLLTDGLAAAALMTVITLAGTWVVPLLQLGNLPRRWHILAGAGLGLGLISALVLTLGVLNLLDRTLWAVLSAGLLVAAVAAVPRLKAATADPLHQEPTHSERSYLWLFLLTAPFLAMVLLVSLVPPGFLWIEEGRGYDVLEYHLQLPKEYFERGGISYTPHNVYGNFPGNVEMLYLSCMVLRGDPYDGAAMAKCVNALLAVLCVFAAYVAGREKSYRAGVTTGVLAACAGWMTYLCGVAYVENGMLLFAMIAAAALLRAIGKGSESSSATGWIRLSGLMAGLACGCKYSAVLLIAVAFLVMTALLPRKSLTDRLRACAGFSLFAFLGFAPWLVKNAAMTGNPVFPLADFTFQAYPEGWGEPQASHFAAAHAPDPAETSLAGRLAAFVSRIPGDPDQRFGPLLFLLAGFRVMSKRRNRVDLLLCIVLLVQVVAWMFATHLYARFAVPMLIPLILLAGRAIDSVETVRGRRAFLTLLLAGTMFNAFAMGRLYVQHLYADGRKLPLEGADQLFLRGMMGGHEHLVAINERLTADAKVLMVGDAKAFYVRPQVDYCVVFNRNPFVEAVRTLGEPEAIVEWFNANGYTHVLVNWAEISRLRRSRYGFAPEVDDQLFERLLENGLMHLATFTTGDPPQPYADLFETPGS